MIYLDLPKKFSDSTEHYWSNIESFRTRKGAIDWMIENYGSKCCDEHGRLIVLTGEEEPEEEKKS